MNKNEKGFSLAVSFGLLIIIFLLSMASFSVLLTSTAISRSVYGKDVTSNVAESGFQRATLPLLQDGATNFSTILGDKGGEVTTGQISYTFAGNVKYTVTIRDNDDLDGNLDVDTDKRVIVTSVGEIPDAGSTSLEIFVEYLGVENEYDQETRTASSSSNFMQSSDVNLDYRATN